MRRTTEFRRDDRGVSATVTHALALGITAILVTGLLFSAGSILDDQRESSAREQLRTVGNRIAEDISRAGLMAQDGGNVTIQARHPETIAGRTYQVRFLTGSDCDTDLFDADACLNLELTGGGTSVMVPVRNETDVRFDRRAGGSFTIAATANDSAQQATVPDNKRDLRVGIGDDIGDFTSGSVVNLTNRDPIAGFTFTPGQPTVSSVIHFENDTEDLDGVITSYEWDLNGDGTVDQTGKEFNHSYSTPGKYTVTLTVTDDDGESDNVSKVISVGGLVYNNDAEAVNETSASVEADVNFTVSNQHGADVEIQEILIDPADNDLDTLDSGDMEVEVAGDLTTGGDDATTTLYDDGVIVDIAEDGSAGSGSLSSGATIWFRGFRDAGTLEDMSGSDVFVALRYEVNGSFYTSQFTLFGGPAGNDPPDPTFNVDCDSAPTCDFTDTSSDDDLPLQDWQWNFGGTGTSSAQNPTHTFPSNGTYDVSLTVTDSDGVSSTLTKSVLVGEPGPPVVFAVNAGGSEISVDGVVYEQDTASNPHPFLTTYNRDGDTSNSIANTSVDDLYQTARYGEPDGFWPWDDPGPFGYDVPLPNGDYRIKFQFAEIDQFADPGEREFDVNVEGNTEIADLDVVDTVGDYHAVYYERNVTVTDGELSIEFFPASNDRAPTVNALVVRQLDAVAFQEKGTDPELVMESEDFHRQVPGNDRDASGDDMSGDGWVTVANASASGGTALEGQPDNGDSSGDTENGPRLDYYVDVSGTPTYYVWVRMYCPSGGSSDDAIHVGLDGQPATYGGSGLNGNASTLCRDTSGWMWASHAAGSPASLNVVEPGQHTVNVWMYDDGVQIDKVVLTTDPGYAPPPSGTGPSPSTES